MAPHLGGNQIYGIYFSQEAQQTNPMRGLANHPPTGRPDWFAGGLTRARLRTHVQTSPLHSSTSTPLLRPSSPLLGWPSRTCPQSGCTCACCCMTSTVCLLIEVTSMNPHTGLNTVEWHGAHQCRQNMMFETRLQLFIRHDWCAHGYSSSHGPRVFGIGMYCDDRG